MHQDTVEQIANLLQSAYGSVSEEKRTSAERALEEYSQSPELYFQCLLAVLSSPTYKYHLRQQSAFHMKKFISEQTSISDPLSIARALIQLIQSDQLEKSIKAILSEALSPLFNVNQESTYVFSTLVPELIQNLSASKEEVRGTCYVIAAGFCNNRSTQNLFELFRYIVSPVVQATQTDPELLHEAADTFLKISEYFKEHNPQLLPEISQETSLIAFTNDVLNYKDEESLILVRTDPQFALINQSKTKILQMARILMGNIASGSPIVNTVFYMVHGFTDSLYKIAGLANFEAVLDLNCVSELITEIFIILKSFLQMQGAFFLDYYKQIVVDICLVFLKITSSEHTKVWELPKEFVDETLEVLEETEVFRVKTAVAEFLRSLCQHIDGSLSFVAGLCYEMLEIALGKMDIAHSSYASAYASSKVFTVNSEFLAEIAFLTLCVLRQNMNKRNDLLYAVDTFVKDNWSLLVNIQSDLVQQRLCLYLQCYLDCLFEEADILNVLKLTLDFCNPAKYKKSTRIQASSSLSVMFGDKEILDKIKCFIPDILEDIIRLIPSQKNIHFYEAIHEIVSVDNMSILPYLKDFIILLVSKIQSLVHKKSIKISKCWNIINRVGENPDVSIEMMLEIEQLVYPLFEYIHESTDFEDDIILFEVNLIKKSKIISEIGWSLFSQLPAIQCRNKGALMSIKSLLNCYIFYGQLSTEVLETILNMCFQCIQSTKNDIYTIEGVFIIQQMLQSYRGVLDDLLKSIFEVTLKKLKKGKMKSYLITRLLGVFLSGFYYNPLLSMHILSSDLMNSGLTQLNYVLKYVFENSHIFRYPYDRKVATLGLLSLLTQEGTPQLDYIFQTILNILVSYSINKNKRSKSEAYLNVSKLLIPISQIDEYQEFRNVLKVLQQNHQEKFHSLVTHLPQEQARLLTVVIRSKMTESGDVRVIAKPKRNLPAQ